MLCFFTLTFLPSKPPQTMEHFLDISAARRKCLCVPRIVVFWSTHFDIKMLVPMLYLKLRNHICISIHIYIYIYIYIFVCNQRTTYSGTVRGCCYRCCCRCMLFYDYMCMYIYIYIYITNVRKIASYLRNHDLFQES